MIHKSGLIIASLAASLTLAFALAAAGFAPGTTKVSADPAAAVIVDAAATAAATDAAPLVQIDKIYVPAPVPQETITVHKVVQTAGGESEGAEGND